MTISLVWRPRAKMVAFVDMTLAVIILVLCIINAVLAALEPVVHKLANQLIANTGLNATSTSNLTETTAVKVWVIWLGVACTSALTALHIWTAVKLMKSTDKRKTPSEALHNSRIWFFLNILLVLVTFPVNIVLLHAYVITGVEFVLRVALILVVFQYNSELKAVLSLQTTVSKVAPQ